MKNKYIKEIVLDKIQFTINRAIPNSLIDSFQSKVEFDDVINAYVISMTNTLLGKRLDPVVSNYYHVPKTWWDALKIAIGIKRGVQYTALPKTTQYTKVCPHLSLKSDKEHVHIKWLEESWQNYEQKNK